jgi:hypothetical protein
MKVHAYDVELLRPSHSSRGIAAQIGRPSRNLAGQDAGVSREARGMDVRDSGAQNTGLRDSGAQDSDAQYSSAMSVQVDFLHDPYGGGGERIPSSRSFTPLGRRTRSMMVYDRRVQLLKSAHWGREFNATKMRLINIKLTGRSTAVTEPK